MTHLLWSWQSCVELFLACDCIIVVVFNLTIIVWKKVYQSWSTFSTIMACSLLLATRAICLIFFSSYQVGLTIEHVQLMSAIISDLPCYLVMNITLALIW